MFERVLFPTDFSPFANQLLECLGELRQAGPEEIVVLHVLEPWEAVGWAQVDGTLLDERKEQAQQKLTDIGQRLQASGFRVRTHVVMGSVHQEIVQMARQDQVSLIVMGTHGHGFFRGAILGSVTHNVARHAQVPVLVYKLRLVEPLGKADCRFVCQRLFRRVLLPTDFSDCAAVALALAELNLSAEVEHITDPVQFGRRQVLLTPGLVVDSQVRSSDRVPSLEEVKQWLREAA